jgi:hypothetical protein
MKRQPSIRIELTPEQQKEAKQTRNQAEASLELSPEVLEERIAPATNLNSSRSNIY